jgi:hypothetical protein
LNLIITIPFQAPHETPSRAALSRHRNAVWFEESSKNPAYFKGNLAKYLKNRGAKRELAPRERNPNACFKSGCGAKWQFAPHNSG